MSYKQRNEHFKNKQKKDYREYLKMAKQKWLEIMNDDKELKKWYKNFLVEAVKSKNNEYWVMDKYHKESLSKKYPF